MEAVAEVAAAEPEAILAVHGGETGLGGEGIKIVEGVGESGGVDYFIRINGVVLIECDKVGGVAGDALELIHVVGDGDGAGVVITRGADEIPCGPEFFVFGELGGVGVQGDGIVLITPWAEASGFLGGGVLEEGEGLVGVGGNNGLVEFVPGAVGEEEGDGILRVAGDALDGGVGLGCMGQGGPHTFDVGAGTAGDVFPLGAVV